MACKIFDGLFIGDAESSQDSEFIELNKISCKLLVADCCDCFDKLAIRTITALRFHTNSATLRDAMLNAKRAIRKYRVVALTGVQTSSSNTPHPP